MAKVKKLQPQMLGLFLVADLHSWLVLVTKLVQINETLTASWALISERWAEPDIAALMESWQVPGQTTLSFDGIKVTINNGPIVLRSQIFLKNISEK